MASTSSPSPSPAGPVLLCTDGSDASIAALRSGLALVGTDAEVALVTVRAEPDVTLVTGTGMAGGTLTPEAFDREVQLAAEESERIINEAGVQLGLADPASYVVEGDPGAAICTLAAEVSARAVVMGTRGRGGVRRAVLGSVSDHVVRNAPCPVVTARGD